MVSTPVFQPTDSSVTPRYSEIATFMRAARAEIAGPLDIALSESPWISGRPIARDLDTVPPELGRHRA